MEPISLRIKMVFIQKSLRELLLITERTRQKLTQTNEVLERQVLSLKNEF